MYRFRAIAALLLLSASQGVGAAGELISLKFLSADLAAELVRNTVTACRAQGYQVSAVVVDRTGGVQALLRDSLAPRFTLQIAEEKANAVILSGVASGEFRRNRSDIKDEMNHVAGVLVLEGGIPIQVAGSLVAALGVSGAPGGERDAACAEEGLATVVERLEFAE